MTKEEAIKNLQFVRNALNNSSNIAKAYDMAIKALEKKQPKKGYWITTDEYFTGAYESIDYVKCSCCREDSLEEGNYCPNCGSKMDGVRNE